MSRSFYKSGKPGPQLGGGLRRQSSSEYYAPFSPLYNAIAAMSSSNDSAPGRQWKFSDMWSKRGRSTTTPSDAADHPPQRLYFTDLISGRGRTTRTQSPDGDDSKFQWYLTNLVTTSAHSATTSARPGEEKPHSDIGSSKKYSSFSITNIQAYRLRSQFLAWGLASQEVKIERPDGVTVVNIWAPDPAKAVHAAGPPKPNLVLIHGFGANALWQWNLQLPKLAPHFNVYIPDLVFFGGSTSTCPCRTEVFQAECMAEVLERLGVVRFDVVGISYGGLVAYRLASMYEDRVRRVVLTDSPGPVMRREDYDKIMAEHGVRDIAELLLPTSPEGIQKLMGIAYYWQLPFPTFILRDVLDNLMSDMVEEKRELLGELVSFMDNPPDTPKLQQETLLIWGQFDSIFKLDIAQRLVEFLKPNAQLKVIKNGAHMPNAEHPQEYNRLLVDFLLKKDKPLPSEQLDVLPAPPGETPQVTG